MQERIRLQDAFLRKDKHRYIAFLIVFLCALSAPLFAQSYDIPEKDALSFQRQLPQSLSELSILLAKGASATRCELDSTQPTCSCLSFKNIQIQKWTPKVLFGVRISNKKNTYFVEKFNVEDSTYVGFWALSQTKGWRAQTFKDNLEVIQFGRIELPADACSGMPKIEVEASAKSAQWMSTRRKWKLFDFQWTSASTLYHLDEEPRSGLLAPRLFLDERQLEIQAGYFIPLINGQLLASISTEGAGLGLGLLSRRPDHRALSQLELGARLNFQNQKVIPYLNGNFFLGSKGTHLSGRLGLDQGLLDNLESTRPLTNRRLMQDDNSKLGLLLSSQSHHLRLGITHRKDESNNHVWASGEYERRFEFDPTVLDISLRNTNRNLESDAPLQSTTLSFRLKHRFGHPGLFLEPSLQLTNNFSVIPIEKGFDASTTGFTIAQLYASLRFIGQFQSLRHIISAQAFAGRDLFGFQQRAIRDGGSPFTFRRQAGFSYAWFGVENSLLSSRWNFEFPVGVLFNNLNDQLSATPIAQIKVFTRELKLRVEGICNGRCRHVAFRASTDFNVAGYLLLGKRLSLLVHYGLSDYTFQDAFLSNARDMGRSAVLPGLGQIYPEPSRFFHHQIALKIQNHAFDFGIEAYFSEELLGTFAQFRFAEKMGWTTDYRVGWSKESGFALQLGLSLNNRFFSP